MQTDAISELIKDVAARVVTPRFRALADGEIHQKRPGDYVTIADHEAEIELADALQAAYPGAIMIGEEAVSARPSILDALPQAEHAFTLDPVDGTKNFVKGSPDHAVMVAELRNDEVVRSWIWQPEHQRMYVAERGAGAWVNGVRMDPPAHDVRANLRLAADLRLRGNIGGIEVVRRRGCCGVDYPLVATGETDAVYYMSGAPWDHAPGSLLLAEVGGWTGRPSGVRYEPAQTPSFGVIGAASEVAFHAVAAAIRPSLGL
ncbi:MAG TPA: inositol monophosphatase [Propionibacteriaceae bacterium]|nr:inositol monophosphatase [Propionibacteriaceae bacterium]